MLIKLTRNLFVYKDVQLTPLLSLISSDFILMVPLYIINSLSTGSENVISNTFEALLSTSTGLKAFYEILFFVVDKNWCL